MRVLGALVSTWQAILARKPERTAKIEARRADTESERARNEEKTARAKEQLAERNALEARRNLYVAEMNLAQQALDQNNLGLCLEFLNHHRPAVGQPDLRGWEWRYLWSLCQSDELYTFASHSSSLGVLAISADGRFLAAAGQEDAVIWDVSSRRVLATIGTGDPDEPYPGLDFSPDEKLLALGRHNRPIVLWDIAAQHLRSSLTNLCPAGIDSVVTYSPDGRTLASTGPDGWIRLLDVSTETVVAVLPGQSAKGFILESAETARVCATEPFLSLLPPAATVSPSSQRSFPQQRP